MPSSKLEGKRAWLGRERKERGGGGEGGRSAEEGRRKK